MEQRVAYFLKYFPKLSETFILQEIVLLKKQLLEIPIFAMYSHENKDGAIHPEAEKLKESVFYIDDQTIQKIDKYLALVYFILMHPIRSLRAFLYVSKRNRQEKIYFNRCLFVAKKLLQKNVTAIHAHFALEATTHAMFVSMLTGIPYTFTTHGYDVYFEGPDNYLDKANYSKKLITVSQFNKKYLADHYQIPMEKIKTVYCGVDRHYFSPISKPRSQKPILLNVSRLHEVKGLEYFIEACYLLDQQKASFEAIIVGEGDLYGELKEQIISRKLEESVFLVGAKTKEEVRDFYRSSDIFVLSSISEAMPISIMEAMSCELPVVATNVRGIPELVQDGETGFLVPTKDPQAICDSIKALLSDASLREKFGVKGRKKIIDQFDIQQNIQELKETILAS